MLRSKLFRKMLLFMVIVFGVITVFTSLLFDYLLESQLVREYESKAKAIARSVADSDTETILQRRAETLQSRIDRYLEIEGVSYVLVADEFGTVLAHTFAPTIPKAVRDIVDMGAAEMFSEEARIIRNVTLDGDREYFHVVQPVLAGVAGAVHIGMDESAIRSFIKAGVLKQQSMTLALFISSVILAYFFIKGISRPLMRLTEYAGKVAAHDFSAVVDIHSRDEVGTLATAMRSMSVDLSILVTGLERAVVNATTELQDTLAYVSAIINNMANGVLVTDSMGRITQCNPALLEMFYLREEHVVSRDCAEVFNPELSAVFTDSEGLYATGPVGVSAGVDRLPPEAHHLEGEFAYCMLSQSKVLEALARRADGTEFTAELTVTMVILSGERNVITIVRDVTRQKQAEAVLKTARDELEATVEKRTHELRLAEEKYRSIFEHAGEGIYQAVPEGRFISANPALARILGYQDPEELMRSIKDIRLELYVDPSRRGEYMDQLNSRGEVTNFESEIYRRDGEVIWISENARLVRDENGEPEFYEGSLQDISLRKQAEQLLKHHAFHDPLTRLPNRLLFLDHLHLAMERAKRRSDYFFAVLYMDLDRFKIVNDSLGHEVGDELLSHVARKLEKSVRGHDTVARFGGDEFAILLEEITAPREAVKICKRILSEFAKPVTLHGNEVFSSASIGIVLITGDYTDPEAILRDADTAMYRAKELGRSRFKVFNQRMHETALRLMNLETELRRALDRDEFRVVYQPIVSLGEKRILGFEALLRWRHQRLGPVSPEEFIPLAEDTGLIFPLGTRVLETACGQMTQWKNMAGDLFDGDNPLTVSVNISGKQFLQPFLVSEVDRILVQTGLAPRHLKLEITENVLMDDVATAGNMLHKLRGLGIRLDIDDFGTGYSSLSYLQQYPIETIKIDRGFVSQSQDNEDSRAIIKIIVSLGQSLGMNVVAEGVETSEQLSFLRDIGCARAQGYLFSRPMEPEAITGMLSRGVFFGETWPRIEFSSAPVSTSGAV